MSYSSGVGLGVSHERTGADEMDKGMEFVKPANVIHLLKLPIPRHFALDKSFLTCDHVLLLRMKRYFYFLLTKWYHLYSAFS